MNLLELKKAVNKAICAAKENRELPEEITVHIQVDINKESAYSSDVELVYDGNGCAFDCVIVGDAE